MKKLGVVLLVVILINAIRSSVFGAVSLNAGKLIITEVAMKETGDADWLELYVVDGSVDWYNYRIWRNASSYYSLPDKTYSTGQYIVLHEESGTDGLVGNCWHFYNALGTGLTGTDQNIFITDPGKTSTYVDAVIYSDNNGSYTASAKKANDLVADDMWNPDYDFDGDAGAWTDSDDINSGNSLARYLDPGPAVYVDNNSKGDWYKSTNPSQGGQNDITLPVTLTSFTATPGDGKVTLCWRTESEVDNLGFYLYRSLSKEGPYVRITPELIPGAGSSASLRDYSHTDREVVPGVTYWYELEDIAFDGTKTRHGPVKATPTAPNLKPESQEAPVQNFLSPNWPNPFNSGTYIRFGVRRRGQVSLAIYNILGQEVRTLVEGELGANVYTIYWDGKDDTGRPVASGVYLYLLQTPGFVEARKMVLLR